MALEFKQSLKLTQQMVMTPQLQQALKLPQMPKLELAETIQVELRENPVLEKLLDPVEEETSYAQRESTGKEKEKPERDIRSDEINWDKYPSEFSIDQSQYITPDVFIYKIDDEFVVVLNENGLPKLQVSPF